MIDYKTICVLMQVLQKPQGTYIELSLKLELSDMEVKQHLELINDLKANNEQDLIKLSNNGYEFLGSISDQQNLVSQTYKEHNIHFDQEIRLSMIYLYLFARSEFVSNYHLQTLVRVSKNTALNDISKLRKELADYKVELLYSRTKGYHLKGEEINKHRYALHSISSLMRDSTGGWILGYVLSELGVDNNFKKIYSQIKGLSETTDIYPIEDKTRLVVWLLQFIFVRASSRKYVIDKFTYSKDLNVGKTYQLVKDLADEYLPTLTLNEYELKYLEYLILGSLTGTSLEENEFFVNLTIDVINEMEQVSLIRFTDKEELYSGLIKHLIPAYFRLVMDFVEDDHYTLAIKLQYNLIFDIVKRALKPLEKEVDRQIPDSEVSYFVIHFGGYITRDKPSTDNQLRALVVCPNGVSSSLIIKKQLEDYFPNIQFLEVSRRDQVDSIDPDDYDLIFSTVSLETDKPKFDVSMIMSEEELERLYKEVVDYFPSRDIYPYEVVELMNVIEKHTNVVNEVELRLELMELYEKNGQTEGDDYPVLADLITAETFQVSDLDLDWKDAIRLATKPLLDKGAIEERYVDAMINRVLEYGPFIDLGKGIAIPHARPEDGVNELSMAMLVLEKPVNLADDPEHPIQIIIIIAASDNNSHLEALSDLTVAIRSEENVERFKNAKKFEDIKDIIERESE